MAELVAQAFLETQPRVIDGVFHVGQALLHDRQHVEVRRADLAREPLAAGIVLGAVALALFVQLLLLVESADDLLQPRFHVAGDVTGLAQVFDDGCREQSDRRRIGADGAGREQGDAENHKRGGEWIHRAVLEIVESQQDATPAPMNRG
ncbi:MAG: hypothetical protein R3288_15975 [Woeseiaceae bacterium]|nr:hypothetical protein [Woeseiaceae bacterium]